ncbi:MAG: Ig-like domain-containing protein [Candidatus Cloacimonetes bacterium]|nr:Ig-like domain-containing protein [Candidatus Cloacimonadota bacterium]
MKKIHFIWVFTLIFLITCLVSCDTKSTQTGGGGGTGPGDLDPVVTDISISPNTVTVLKGGNYQFTATVMGRGDHNKLQEVTWSASGGVPGTRISATGLLTISDEEIAETIVVTVTSNHKTADGRYLSAIAIVTISYFGGEWYVSTVDQWIAALQYIKAGRNNAFYVITVSADISLPVTTGNTFGSPTGIMVTICGTGSLALSANGTLLQSGTGQTIIIQNITLYGKDSNNASLVIVNTGSAIRLEDSTTITGNFTSGTAGGVLIRTGGVFTLDSSVIEDNSSSSSSGVGGVAVEGGVFYMRGSSRISDNKCTYNYGSSAGGVYVQSNGTFHLENGTITRNTDSSDAGGVRVHSNGTFNMQNGTISYNIANSGNGGGVYVAGRFTLQNGLIAGNSARNGFGGGLYLTSSAVFTKPGGTITGSNTPAPEGNTASNQGAAAYLPGSPNKWRNVAAGAGDIYDEFFWRND